MLAYQTIQKKDTNDAKEGKYTTSLWLLSMYTLHMSGITQATNIILVRCSMSHLSNYTKQDHHHKNSNNDQCGDQNLLPHMMNLWSIWLIRNGFYLAQILQGMLHLLHRMKAF